MKATFKLPGPALNEVQIDLQRRHPFAHERVGFLTAGVVETGDSNLILLAREYQKIDDDDYLSDSRVGAMIGAKAMRKALQMAYATKSALFHVHAHGGSGIPNFSSIDLKESQKFVPSFFNVIPQMPHGVIVLSNDSARGLLWFSADRPAVNVSAFREIGAPLKKFGEMR